MADAFAEMLGVGNDDGEQTPAVETEQPQPGNEIETDEPDKTAGSGQQPLPAEDDEDDEDDTGGQSDTVPHNRFHAERQRRKAAEDESRQLQERIAKMEAKFEQYVSMAQQPAKKEPEAPQLPDISEDPIGHIQQRFAQYDQTVQEYQQTEQQRAVKAQLDQHINISEANFSAQTQDYYPTIQSYKQTRYNQMVQAGFNQQTAAQTVHSEIMMVAMDAIRNHRDPAQTVYGYVKTIPLPAAQQNGANTQQTAGGSNFDMVQRGQKAAKSVGAGSGKTVVPPSLAQLASDDISDKEFLAQWDNVVRKHVA